MVRRVVIVEDNPADAKILRLALTRKDPNLELSVFENGAKALEYFTILQELTAPEPCNLIVLDLNLPRVSGFELLAFLKTNSQTRQIPVVVLSGSSSQTDITRVQELGGDSCLCKPLGVDQVFEMAAQLVTKWLDRASAKTS